jgi:prepilin-type N-terminal cleavage/methylation domain-containing protein
MLKIKRMLSKKGFTLIEVIIAIAILGMASLGIFQSYKVGFWGMSDARARTIATNIAQEKLEEVKGKSLDTGTFPDPGNPIVVSGKEFNATIIVEEIKSTLKKITTTVNWQKRNGEQTEISIESLLNMPPVFPADDVATSILINANPPFIGVNETTTIKVTILDQDNYPISYNGQVDLSLTPSPPGLGTLADYYLTFTGESYLFTTFTATDAGEVKVEGKSTGLSPNSVTITITGGPPVKINLVADPSSILIGGEISTLTIRIEDENDKLADSWTGTVTLSILSGSGTLASTTLNFNGENIKTTLFTSSVTPGTVEIKAEASGTPSLSSVSDIETITVSSGPPTKIDIEANPKNIFIEGYTGGSTSSYITVIIKNATDIPTGWTGTVTLSISSGEDSGSFDNLLDIDSIDLNFSGESELSNIIFYSSFYAGTVEIKAEDKTGGPGYIPLSPDTEIITVALGPPNKLQIEAVPNIILANGSDSSTIIIKTLDSEGNQSGVIEETIVTLSLTPTIGNLQDTTITFYPGESYKTTIFTSNEEGNVRIDVNDITSTLSPDFTNVQISKKIIRPPDDPNIHYGRHWSWGYFLYIYDVVYFDIEVLVAEGTGINGLTVTDIDLSWDPTSARLEDFYINDEDDDIIYHKHYSSSRTTPLTISGVNTFLQTGQYTICLDYNMEILGKTIEITFHTDYNGQNFSLIYYCPEYII